jgi:pimeloyl-ACP methyl ester carboxylesterase
MKKLMQFLIDATFAPPRALYDPRNTVSAITSDDGSVFQREMVEFVSDSYLKLMGSLWRDQRNLRPAACTIFLHSLGTNQFEVINLVPFLCNQNLALFSFDFPGCGVSEGKAMPLDGSGSQVVLAAVRHLKEAFGFTRFALWGRSMGAAIGLHAVSLCHEFKCVVSDSSFATTRKVIDDQAAANKIPRIVVCAAFPFVRAEAERLLDMNVDCPFPLDFVQFAQTPLLMGHASRDVFVPMHHAQEIFANYGYKDKQLYIFEGKHNSPRPHQWYESAARFIYKHTGVKEKAKRYPWMYTHSYLHSGLRDVVLREIEAQRKYEQWLAEHPPAPAPSDGDLLPESAAGNDGNNEGESHGQVEGERDDSEDAQYSDTSYQRSSDSDDACYSSHCENMQIHVDELPNQKANG